MTQHQAVNTLGPLASQPCSQPYSQTTNLLLQQLSSFLLSHHRQDVLNLLARVDKEDEQRHYGVTCSLTELGAWDASVASRVIQNARESMEVFDTALLEVENVLIEQLQDPRLSVKEHVRVRLVGPPGFSESGFEETTAHSKRSNVRAELLNNLVGVTGTVAKTGVVNVLESRKNYECASCGYRFAVVVDDLTNDVSLPKQCPSTTMTEASCNSATFVENHLANKTFTNYQEIQVQEHCDKIVNNNKKAVTVVLQDDLADTCQIGQVVHITGIVVRHASLMRGGSKSGQKAVVTLALKAVSVSDNQAVVDGEEDDSTRDTMYRNFELFWERKRLEGLEMTARDAIVGSLCPMLRGMFGIKLSVLLMLLGGTDCRGTDGRGPEGGGTHENDKGGQNDKHSNQKSTAETYLDEATGTQTKRHKVSTVAWNPPNHSNSTRSQIHLLLVGDPGTGKSQIQKFVASVDPRTIMASGSSTTAAGLTAAAVKENGQWTLEAGALVLANGGVCCIDEIDGLKASDSAALHEVMEQQTCSVAKAGMITTLHTKVSIFGTCNPKGNRRIDPRRSLNDQLGLPSPLLSRFDVIMLLLDDMNPASDASIVDHVLRMRGTNASDAAVIDLADSFSAPGDETWHLDKLKAYLRWCKETFHPQVSKEAKHALIAYYQARRALRADHVTVRFFESLIRLSQAHAKLMARGTATIDDAVVAICLTDSSISLQDEGVFQIPPQLRLSEMGYVMNHDSAEAKAREVRRIVMRKLLEV